PTPTPTPTPAPAPAPAAQPTAAAGTPPLPPPPPPGAPPTPLYRMEVPVYAELPPIARELTVQQIGTFHERQGEQSLLTENGALPAAWARVWGGHTTQHNSGAADSEFSGGIGGVQVGHDLYADTTPSGHRNHYGFFFGFARASGDVNGFALGFPNADAGHLSINAYSAGLYWTHIGPNGWYTDAVLLGSSLTADPQSNRGVGATTHGSAFAASIEAGLPMPLPAGLAVEPQLQLIWQHANLHDIDDGISTVSFHEASGFIGRLGVRFYGHFDASGTTFEPYLRANLWRYFGATDNATFAGVDVIPTNAAATTAQLGAGIVAKVSVRGSVFANLAWSTNLGGSHRSALGGGLGVRWKW
ncbi:autotransporter family protein, partial [Caballeronia catudaia]